MACNAKIMSYCLAYEFSPHCFSAFCLTSSVEFNLQKQHTYTRTSMRAHTRACACAHAYTSNELK